MTGSDWLRVPKLAIAGSVFVLLFANQTFAQEGAIEGEVLDSEDLSPVAGAQVFVVDTEIGTLSGNDGQFRITGVPAGRQTIRVRVIGFETLSREVNVQAGQATSVTLRPARGAVALDDIVVTGTGGAVQERSVGTVIDAIDADEFANESPATVAEVLEGRTAGLTTTTGGGGSAGEATALELRGASSIIRSTQPVIYIDGIRISNRISETGIGDGNFRVDHLSNIDPDNIARVEVLRGAAATTLYGTQASNGVVQIFTKSGSADEPRFDASITQGIGRIPRDLVPVPVTYAGGEIISSDPRDAVLRTGRNEEYNLSVRGGSEEVNYFVSGDYTNRTAPVVQSGLEQYSGRVNLSTQVSSDLNVGLQAFYTDRGIQIPGTRNQVQGAYANTILSFPQARSEERPYGGLFVPVPNATEIERRVDSRHFIGGANISYAPVENLETRLSLGIDVSDGEQVYYEPFGVPIQGNTLGAKELHHQNSRNITADLQTTWTRDLGESFSSRLSVGGQAFFDTNNTSFIGVRGFPGPGLETVGSASTITGYGETQLEEISAGLFVQEQISYEDRLFVTGGLRLDGHSAFGSDYGIEPYPKVNVSYVVSEESFWNVDMVEQLRLRAAYGTAGLAPGPFDAQRSFVSSTYDGEPAIVPGTLGQADLKPERSREIELGADGGLFDNRLSFNVTYFNQKTSDALVPRTFPPSGGFLNPQLVNAGTITNTGFELATNLLVTQSDDFSWRMTGSLSTLSAEVDLGGAAPIRPGYQRFRNYFITGYSPSAFFGSKLNAENPYDILIDGNTNPSNLSEFNSIDQIRVNTLENAAGGDSLAFLGKPQADVSGNVGLNFSLFGNVQLNTSFAWESGMSTYNLTDFLRSNLGIHRDVAEIQRELAQSGTSDDRKRELASEYAHLSARAESNWVENSDYIRWSRANVTYTLPESVSSWFLNAREMSVSVTGRNLAVFTDYRGSDPNTNAIGASSLVRNTDFIQAPRARTVNLRVDVSF